MISCAAIAAAPALTAGPLAPGTREAPQAPNTTGRPIADIAAAPAVLWMDGRSGWVHQQATAFNIYLRIGSPRLRYAVARAARAWSLRTRLTMRVVRDPRIANVVADDGYHGPGMVTAYTQTCELCQMSWVVFNLDKLNYPRTPAADRKLETIACQELGHVAGLWHGGGDCMSFGYQRTYTYGVGAANAQMLDAAYREVPYGLPSRLAALPPGG